MLICGVDEAGRGPVIGPMVICGVIMEQADEPRLSEMGVKDSKLLTPQQREDIIEHVKKAVKDFSIVVVSPQEIDKAVESENTNLNWLEADKFAEIINQLKPDVAYIDCSSTNEEAFEDYIRARLRNKEIKLVVEHKADFNYPVVGAASIIAKVTRDNEIEKLKQKFRIDFGSGYPADPFTKQFLEKNFDKYNFFRKSWSSWKNAASKNCQTKLFF
jgi:ribonuclease HII